MLDVCPAFHWCRMRRRGMFRFGRTTAVRQKPLERRLHAILPTNAGVRRRQRGSTQKPHERQWTAHVGILRADGRRIGTRAAGTGDDNRLSLSAFCIRQGTPEGSRSDPCIRLHDRPGQISLVGIQRHPGRARRLHPSRRSHRIRSRVKRMILFSRRIRCWRDFQMFPDGIALIAPCRGVGRASALRWPAPAASDRPRRKA